MTRILNWLLRRHPHEHDWVPVGFFETSIDSGYIRLDECSVCHDVLVIAP